MARTFDADELHWYALDVVRQKEYVAGHIFNRMGWMTFIPTETRFRRKNRYAKAQLEVAHPEFPGVVFVGFPQAPNWLRVMSLHLVNGVISVPDIEGRVYPRRIETGTKEWMDFRAFRTDGQLTIERHKVLVRVKGEEVEIERSVPFVQVQGRGVIRSTKNLKTKAGGDRPIVIRAAGERARLLGELLGKTPHVAAEAA
jgi:hypothetical protein